MFNMYVTVPFRTSNAIDSLEVDLIRQLARCTFKSGGDYEYMNVSKRAIVNVLFNPDVSLGFWVNNNLVNSDRAIEIGRPISSVRRRLKLMLDRSEGFEEVNLPSFV